MAFKNPEYHYIADKSWMNDPIAPFTYNNEHHVYYQTTPNEPLAGINEWSHIKTKDFVNWSKYKTGSLTPDTYNNYDKSGCWSGSCILHRFKDKPDVLQILYTGVETLPIPPGQPELWMQTQCTAFAVEPFNNFIKYEGNPIINKPPYKELGLNNHSQISGWRDPWIFKIKNEYYMTIGSGIKGKYPIMLLYKHIKNNNKTNEKIVLNGIAYDMNDFLINFKFVGNLFDGTHSCFQNYNFMADMFECVNIYKMNIEENESSNINNKDNKDNNNVDEKEDIEKTNNNKERWILQWSNDFNVHRHKDYENILQTKGNCRKVYYVTCDIIIDNNNNNDNNNYNSDTKEDSNDEMDIDIGINNIGNIPKAVNVSKTIECMDYSSRSYATTHFIEDIHQRHMVFSWIDEDNDVREKLKQGWSGVQALPRQIKLINNDYLAKLPIEELKQLRMKTNCIQFNKSFDRQNQNTNTNIISTEHNEFLTKNNICGIDESDSKKDISSYTHWNTWDIECKIKITNNDNNNNNNNSILGNLGKLYFGMCVEPNDFSEYTMLIIDFNNEKFELDRSNSRLLLNNNTDNSYQKNNEIAEFPSIIKDYLRNNNNINNNTNNNNINVSIEGSIWKMKSMILETDNSGFNIIG